MESAVATDNADAAVALGAPPLATRRRARRGVVRAPAPSGRADRAADAGRRRLAVRRRPRLGHVVGAGRRPAADGARRPTARSSRRVLALPRGEAAMTRVRACAAPAACRWPRWAARTRVAVELATLLVARRGGRRGRPEGGVARRGRRPARARAAPRVRAHPRGRRRAGRPRGAPASRTTGRGARRARRRAGRRGARPARRRVPAHATTGAARRAGGRGRRGPAAERHAPTQRELDELRRAARPGARRHAPRGGGVPDGLRGRRDAADRATRSGSCARRRSTWSRRRPPHPGRAPRPLPFR